MELRKTFKITKCRLTHQVPSLTLSLSATSAHFLHISGVGEPIAALGSPFQCLASPLCLGVLISTLNLPWNDLNCSLTPCQMSPEKGEQWELPEPPVLLPVDLLQNPHLPPVLEH